MNITTRFLYFTQTNMITLILLLLSSLFSITNASPFPDGIAIGYMMTDIQEKILYDESTIKVKHNYYNFTRDTSLQTFPIDYNPQCILEKHFTLDIPLTLEDNILLSLIYIIILSPTMCLCCLCDYEGKVSLTGIYFGIVIHNLISS